MSRGKRTVRKRYLVFCEGDTEYYYIDGMRKRQGTELSLKPIPMDGGGYTNFLNKIKESPDSNCLAKFVILDFDRANNDMNEERCLESLIEYCKCENQKKKIPYLIIINNPDFEYISCLHIPTYRDKNTNQFITKTLGFHNVSEFKSNEEIYEYLNTRNNSYQNAISRLMNKKTIIQNIYKVQKRNFEIEVREINYDSTAKTVKGSNLKDLFEVINW